MTLQDVMELAKQLSPMDKKCLVEQLSSELKSEEVKPKTLEEIKAILIPYKPFLIEKPSESMAKRADQQGMIFANLSGISA